MEVGLHPCPQLFLITDDPSPLRRLCEAHPVQQHPALLCHQALSSSFALHPFPHHTLPLFFSQERDLWSPFRVTVSEQCPAFVLRGGCVWICTCSPREVGKRWLLHTARRNEVDMCPQDDPIPFRKVEPCPPCCHTHPLVTSVSRAIFRDNWAFLPFPQAETGDWGGTSHSGPVVRERS